MRFNLTYKKQRKIFFLYFVSIATIISIIVNAKKDGTGCSGGMFLFPPGFTAAKNPEVR